MDASGAIEWDESIGDTLNDEAHIIRRMPGGAYVMAGEFGSGPAELQNFYVVQFQHLECTAISGPSLQASVQNCSTVAFSWDAVACAAYYELAYRIDGGSWVAVTTTSPQKPVTGLSPGSKYSWRVRSICSPNVQSSFVTGAGVTLTSCKTGYDNSSADIFSVHPNPAEGQLEFLLVLHEKLDGISSISVIDLFGKAVLLSEAKMESGVLKKQLWLGHIPSGFYWLNIELNGEVYRTKLILQ